MHETIEGETILINLETGTYYSLRGTGAEIWGLLSSGIAPDGVVAELRRRYTEDREAVTSSTEQLVEQLLDEGLLEQGEPLEPLEPPASRSEAAVPGASFEPPVLERFTDMQYFLLLDPIHEVHDTGWPKAPAPDTAGTH